MSVRKFCWLLNDADIGKNDKTWFPRWLRRYASSVQELNGSLTVSEEHVVRFSCSLRDSGTPVWQRLQAVRAVEAYRNLVLRRTADENLHPSPCPLPCYSAARAGARVHSNLPIA